MKASLLIIDESRLFREGLRRILEGSPFQVDYEADCMGEVAELQDRFGDVKPDLILIDSQDEDGILLKQLQRLSVVLPQARVVFLTHQVRISRLALAFSAGICGYLLKDISGDALRESLRLVQIGEKVFPSSLAAILVEGHLSYSSREPADSLLEAVLSRREKQILGCLGHGHPNKTIANTLGITESTVKGHLKVLLTKIKVDNRTQAAIWAMRNGLISEAMTVGGGDAISAGNAGSGRVERLA